MLPPIFAKYGTYDIASKAPFTRIPYLEAMEKYGSDKPDLRIDLVVQDITALVQGTEFAPFAPGNVVKAVAVSGCEMTRKQIDKLCADVEVQAATSLIGSRSRKTASSSAASASSSMTVRTASPRLSA